MKFDQSMLSGYLDGELTPEEREAVEQQLERSPEDRQTLQALATLKSRLSRLPAESFATDPVVAVRARIGREGATPMRGAGPAGCETRGGRRLWWLVPLALAASLGMILAVSNRQHIMQLATDDVAIGSASESRPMAPERVTKGEPPASPEIADGFRVTADSLPRSERRLTEAEHMVAPPEPESQPPQEFAESRFGPLGAEAATESSQFYAEPGAAERSTASDRPTVDPFQPPEPAQRMMRRRENATATPRAARGAADDVSAFAGEAVDAATGDQTNRAESTATVQLFSLDMNAEQPELSRNPAQPESLASLPSVTFELPPGEVTTTLSWIARRIDARPYARSDAADAEADAAPSATAGGEPRLADAPVAVRVEATPDQLARLVSDLEDRLGAPVTDPDGNSTEAGDRGILWIILRPAPETERVAEPLEGPDGGP